MECKFGGEIVVTSNMQGVKLLWIFNVNLALLIFTLKPADIIIIIIIIIWP